MQGLWHRLKVMNKYRHLSAASAGEAAMLCRNVSTSVASCRLEGPSEGSTTSPDTPVLLSSAVFPATGACLYQTA